DPAAGHREFRRPATADQVGQHPGAHREIPARRAGPAKPRRGTGDPQVGGGRKLGTAGHRRAAHRRDHRARPRDHDFQALVEQSGYLGSLGLADCHVGPRAEHVLPGAAQHHEFPGVLGEGVAQRAGQGRVQRVVPLRAGEEKPAEAVRAAFCPEPGARHGHDSPGSRQQPGMLKYGIPNGPEAPAAKEVPTASGSTAGARGTAGGSGRHGRRLRAARPAAPGGTAGGSRRHGRRLPAARPAAPGGTAGGASRQHGRALAEGWGSRVKPASFAYHRARSVPEAIALLAELGDEAKILAGGLSLVPMMNFRLARPSALVGITRIRGLPALRANGGGSRIGALAPPRAIETTTTPAVLQNFGVLPRAARWIGHYPIRSRGTFGGSIAHADPASEWCLLALLLGAQVVLHGPGG